MIFFDVSTSPPASTGPASAPASRLPVPPLLLPLALPELLAPPELDPPAPLEAELVAPPDPELLALPEPELLAAPELDPGPPEPELLADPDPADDPEPPPLLPDVPLLPFELLPSAPFTDASPSAPKVPPPPPPHPDTSGATARRARAKVRPAHKEWDTRTCAVQCRGRRSVPLQRRRPREPLRNRERMRLYARIQQFDLELPIDNAPGPSPQFLTGPFGRG